MKLGITSIKLAMLIGCLLGSSLTVFAVPRALTKVIASSSQFAHSIAASRIAVSMKKGATWLTTNKASRALGTMASFINNHPVKCIVGALLLKKLLFLEEKNAQKILNENSNHREHTALFLITRAHQQLALWHKNLMNAEGQTDSAEKITRIAECKREIAGWGTHLSEALERHNLFTCNHGTIGEAAKLHTVGHYEYIKGELQSAKNTYQAAAEKSYFQRVREIPSYLKSSGLTLKELISEMIFE